MKVTRTQQSQSLLTSTATQRGESGSVLIIVLWVAFGLIALTLYFANSMSFELRASDNRASSVEADAAIAGAARYVSNVLATVKEPATLPDINNYRSEAVPLGDATFWIIGRSDRNVAADQASFGLVDEASKLNLNAPWLTVDLLMNLPKMTAELAGAIIDRRRGGRDVSTAHSSLSLQERALRIDGGTAARERCLSRCGLR